MTVNSNPGNSVVTASTSHAQTAGLWPVLVPATIGAEFFIGFRNHNRLEGFAGDGDFIELPILAGNNIEYFNAAGSSQWTKNMNNCTGGSTGDAWVGFFFDDDLIYGVAVDEGLGKFFTFSINAAGTVDLIGNVIPGSAFTTTAGEMWNIATNTTGETRTQREAVGSGNIIVIQDNGGGAETMVLDITDGSVVSNPTPDSPAVNDTVWWKTTDGLKFVNHSSAGLRIITTDGYQMTFGHGSDLSKAIGLPDNALKLIQWKDRIYGVSAVNAAIGGEHAQVWEISVFDTWVKDMARLFGGEV